MVALLADLFEGAAKRGEYSAIFVPVHFFFELDEFFETEDSDEEMLAEQELVGVGEEILVAQVASDGTEEIQ